MGWHILKIAFIFSTIISIVPVCESMLSDMLQRDAATRAMPVQMDMASDNDITICTGNERTVNCRDGANMAVTNVFWGRLSDQICPSDDADPVTDCNGARESLGLVKRYCEGKKECRLAAKHKLLQNNGSSHCPGVNKYLVVNYTCIPESQGVTLCNNVETTLHCGADWVMELADVFWGRRANAKICGSDDSYECDASDFAGKVLKKKCNGKKRCHIRADPDELNSKSHSCGSVAKYLMVNYICRPATLNVEPGAEDEDVKETSSKELMGLIEKHINAPKQATATKKPSNIKSSFASVHPKKQSLSVAKSPEKLYEDDEDFYKNIKKDETPNSKSSIVKNEETLNHDSNIEAKKGDLVTSKDSVATHKDDKSANIINENSYEVSEPNTVRSILDRAKEVLKSLDADALPSDDIINKRGGIAKHVTSEKEVPDAKFVNDTARAVKQVAQLAQKLVKHAEQNKILKFKTANLMKKSMPQQLQNKTTSTTTMFHNVNSKQMNASFAVDVPKQNNVKRNTLPRIGELRFGNTP